MWCRETLGKRLSICMARLECRTLAKWGDREHYNKNRRSRDRKVGKLNGDFSSSALWKSCPKEDSAAQVLWINTTSLSPNSFLLSLTFASISECACPFIALLDSGSSHCFVDEIFTIWNKLPLIQLLTTITILLQLFNGSAKNSVSKKTMIPISFSMGETHNIEFYATKLDKSYSAILGYNWLVWHNPSIDWIETKVVFLGATGMLKESPIPVNSKIDIQLVTTKKFSHLCWEPGNTLYAIEHHSDTGNSSTPHSKLLKTSHSENPS